VAFALNYDIPDITVFFIPAFWLAWIAAGRGAESVVRAVARRAPHWERAAVAAPDSAATPAAIALRANGQPLGVRTMTPGWQPVEWSIPQSVTRPVNELAVVTSSRVVAGAFSFSRQ
jgi:hypothetical protein